MDEKKVVEWERYKKKKKTDENEVEEKGSKRWMNGLKKKGRGLTEWVSS